MSGVTQESEESSSLLHQMEQRLIELISQATQQKSFGQINLTASVESGRIVSLKVGFIEQIR